MKKKTKTIGVLLTGIALAVGIAVSGGVIRNSHVVDETLAATTYSHTITAKTWSSYGVQELSGIDWTASATGGAYWGYDATKGQQFGSSGSPAKPLNLKTSDIPGTITSVKVSTSGASSVTANLSVSVGGSAFSPSSQAITATNTSYQFTGSNSGEISITWDQTSSKALYLKTLEIAYSEGAPKILSSIAITGDLSKTAYYTNDSWSPAGLTVTGTYDDSTTGDVTDDVTWSFNPATPNNTSISSVNITAEIGDILDEVTKSVTVNEAPPIAELFISEYIEGNSNNRAVEIYNGTGSSINLSSYKINLYFNGSNTATPITLSGSINNNSTYIVANSSAVNAIKDIANLTSGSLSFNGNDAVALEKSGSNIDVIGTIGSSVMFGEDVTLVRKASVAGPTIIFDSGEWNSYAIDTFDYLGNHSTKQLEGIDVTGTLAKTSYYDGEQFDPSGLTITATYSDSSTAIVTGECSFSPNPLTVSTTSVTASYNEGGVVKTATIGGINVSSKTLASISVLTNPTKMSYVIGQSFDSTGMKIKATFNAGPDNNDYLAYTYSPTSVFDSLGEKTITITSTENTGISTQLVVTVSEVSTGIYTIASNTTTYTDPLNPALLSISKSDSNLDNLTFSNISNVRLGASPNTSAIMIGANKTTGGSFTITLPTGLYAANVKFSGLSVGEDATTPTLKINNGVNFTYNGSNVETLKPYSNSLIISTLGTSRIWASSIEITAVLASTAALDFGTHFLAKTAAECSTLSVSQGTWNYVQSVYENAASAVQNIVKVADSDENGTDLEKAIARYTYIASKYGYADFMNLGISSSSNNTNEIGEKTHNVAIILIVSLVGASVLVGYRLMPKKKED